MRSWLCIGFVGGVCSVCRWRRSVGHVICHLSLIHLLGVLVVDVDEVLGCCIFSCLLIGCLSIQDCETTSLVDGWLRASKPVSTGFPSTHANDHVVVHIILHVAGLCSSLHLFALAEVNRGVDNRGHVVVPALSLSLPLELPLQRLVVTVAQVGQVDVVLDVLGAVRLWDCSILAIPCSSIGKVRPW